MPPRMNGNGNGAAVPGPQGIVVPFTSASHEHTEQAFDVTVTPGENSQDLGPFDIPAFGYYRHLLLQVETVEAGEAGEAEAHADFPWNLFDRIQISDVNGADIFGPLSGYSTLWASITGGYAGRPDPRVMPYTSEQGGDLTEPEFLLRVPQEISHYNGYGSLANQSTAANYKIFLTLNSVAKLVSDSEKTPSSAPKLRIRGYVETWSLPEATDPLGRAQEDQPPMLDSSQYYSKFIRSDIQAGDNTVLMTRVGSLIRNLIIIARDSEGNRSDEVFPDPVTLEWDSRRMRRDTQRVITEHLAASVPELKTRDAGVFAYLFDRSTKNTVGDDRPALWYPTVQSTRLEVSGTAEAAGSWEIITNDVAPVAVTPQERYVQESATGFHPESVGAGQVGPRS